MSVIARIYLDDQTEIRLAFAASETSKTQQEILESCVSEGLLDFFRGKNDPADAVLAERAKIEGQS